MNARRQTWARLTQLAESGQRARTRGAKAGILEELDLLTEVANEAELIRAKTVERARDAGLTWSAIAHPMGLTKQAAQQRYGKAGD